MRCLIVGEFDNLGDQQGLRGNTVLGHLRFKLFVHQPLMGGVLINDDDAVFGLGDDIILMHLRAGGPQGQIIGLIFNHRFDACRGGFTETRGLGLKRHGACAETGPVHLIDAGGGLFWRDRPKRCMRNGG